MEKRNNGHSQSTGLLLTERLRNEVILQKYKAEDISNVIVLHKG